jgi:hypothetical protein
MPLTNLESTDLFPAVETKIDAAIDKVNEIDVNLTGGETGQILKKSSSSDYDYEWDDISVDTKDVGYDTWSGSQALTGSYVVAGTITHTTPDDGITRYYQIFAEASLQFGNSTSSTGQDAFLKIRNTTLGTDLSTPKNLLIVTADPTHLVNAYMQGVCIYSGLILPNTVIELHLKNSAGTCNILSASMSIVEVYKD